MPFVDVELPPSWIALTLATPPLAEGSGASWTQHNAWRSADARATLSVGCVATRVPGWVEDMRPQISARTVALAGAAAERATGTPMDARDENGELALRAVSDLSGPVLGHARTFLGFDGPRVVTCFATCVARTPRPVLGCEEALSSARLVAGTPPPPPGVVLALVTSAVHHPSESAAAAAAAILVFATLGIVLRRKPRHRAL